MTDKTYRERLVSAHYSFGSVAYILASEADAEIAALKAENFKLAAGVCPMGFGDEGGTPWCCAEARIKELEAYVREYDTLLAIVSDVVDAGHMNTQDLAELRAALNSKKE